MGEPTAAPSTPPSANFPRDRFRAVNTGTSVFVIDTSRTVVLSFDIQYGSVSANFWQESLELFLAVRANIVSSAIERITFHPAARDTTAVAIVLRGADDADRLHATLSASSATISLFVSGSRYSGRVFSQASYVGFTGTAAPSAPPAVSDASVGRSSTTSDGNIPTWIIVIVCVACACLVVSTCFAVVVIHRRTSQHGGKQQENAEGDKKGEAVAPTWPGFNARSVSDVRLRADGTRGRRSNSPVRIQHTPLSDALPKNTTSGGASANAISPRASVVERVSESPSVWQRRLSFVPGVSSPTINEDFTADDGDDSDDGADRAGSSSLTRQGTGLRRLSSIRIDGGGGGGVAAGGSATLAAPPAPLQRRSSSFMTMLGQTNL